MSYRDRDPQRRSLEREGIGEERGRGRGEGRGEGKRGGEERGERRRRISVKQNLLSVETTYYYEGPGTTKAILLPLYIRTTCL